MATNGFSAVVSLTLEVAGQRLSLSHVEPERVTIREKCDPVAPQEAVLHVRVDEHCDSRRVFLDEGISEQSRDVAYRCLDSADLTTATTR